MGDYTISFIMYVVSIICMLGCLKFVSADRKLKLIVYFTVVGELFGIMPRALTIISGKDKVLGAYETYFTPTITEINHAIWLIIIFNFAFITGIFFVSIQQMAMANKIKKPYFADSPKIMSEQTKKKIAKILLLISIPGVLLILYSVATGGTLLTNSNLEASRIDVSGTGPIIFIKEIPITALLLWFSLNKGKAGKRWFFMFAFIIGITLLTGVRSIMVTSAVMALIIYLLNNGYKTIMKRVPLISVIGIVVFYLGWITFVTRGSLLRSGGSFWFWVKGALKTNPFEIINLISQGSFNGFDGLINIVRYVPAKFQYHVGRFWYESATFLIPRSVWHGKWELQLTNLFTGNVFGWSQGGIFVTAPGVLFIDSGWWGVAIGAFVIGAFITTMLYIYKGLLKNHEWIRNYCFACCAFFMFRFTFAGGSNDVGVVQRLLVEAFIILFFVKFTEAFEKKYSYNTTAVDNYLKNATLTK